VRVAPDKCDPPSLTSLKSARLRSAILKLAFVRSAPGSAISERSARMRFIPRRLSREANRPSISPRDNCDISWKLGGAELVLARDRTQYDQMDALDPPAPRIGAQSCVAQSLHRRDTTPPNHASYKCLYSK